jgi:hypothetical protein
LPLRAKSRRGFARPRYRDLAVCGQSASARRCPGALASAARIAACIAHGNRRGRKRRNARWAMTEAEALERDPGAIEVVGTDQVRELPETQQERDNTLYKR